MISWWISIRSCLGSFRRNRPEGNIIRLLPDIKSSIGIISPSSLLGIIPNIKSYSNSMCPSKGPISNLICNLKSTRLSNKTKYKNYPSKISFINKEYPNCKISRNNKQIRISSVLVTNLINTHLLKQSIKKVWNSHKIK
jgi:hypothetical protein